MTNKDIELERTALEAAAVHSYDPHFERFCNPCGKTLGWRPARSGGSSTPEWRCWERHLGRSMPDARDGWWFDSRLPPLMDPDSGPPKPPSRSRHGVPMSPAAIKAIADRADRTRP